MSTIQNPESSVQSPKSSVKCPDSRVQRPESSLQSPASRFQRPESSILNSASRVQCPGSCVQSLASNLASRVQEFWYAFFSFLFDLHRQYCWRQSKFQNYKKGNTPALKNRKTMSLRATGDCFLCRTFFSFFTFIYSRKLSSSCTINEMVICNR